MLFLTDHGVTLRSIHHFLMKTPINWAQYIVENENQAISDIYSEHRSSFIGWVKNNSNCDDDTAIDIFQVSIVILYENVIRGKITELDNVKSYLFRIGKNKLLEHYRAIKKSQHQKVDENVLLNMVLDQDSNSDYPDLVAKIMSCLSDLGDPCKTLLENYYFNNMSLEEIAIKMNYKNSATVKTKKFKCIQRLRKLYSLKMK